jgi:Uma2 family endonuclease
MDRRRNPPFPFDPVIEAYKKDIDRTLLRENLKRSIDERFEQLMELQRFGEELRRAGHPPECYRKAMAVETLVSLDEYLSTSYDPDVEYVDGELVERNVGDWLHSLVQRNIIAIFVRKYPDILAVGELRSRTRTTRYRLPDVCVVLSPPQTKYLLDAAFVAIEILSEDDRMSRMIEKLKEYAANGTPYIWVLDPRLKQMFKFEQNALIEVMGEEIATENPRLVLTRAEIFDRC